MSSSGEKTEKCEHGMGLHKTEAWQEQEFCWSIIFPQFLKGDFLFPKTTKRRKDSQAEGVASTNSWRCKEHGVS